METLSRQPGNSIWTSAGNRAEAKAIYNMLGNEKFDRDEIIKAHRNGTIKRMADQPVILAVQDTTGVRGHWGIENTLHYVLDVAFGEDGSRLRKDKGPENMAILRKPALTAARADTETKSSIIGRRKQLAWSDDYLERLLFQSSLVSNTTDSG
jgi:predicted transposase YbfD/YdcC